MQKQAKQLKVDVNSKEFRDAMRYIWMPRLAERIQAASGSSSTTGQPATNDSMTSVTTSSDNTSMETQAENPSMENGSGWMQKVDDDGVLSIENFWNEENIWFLQQQLM